MPGQSKLLEVPSASKKSRQVSTVQTSDTSGDASGGIKSSTLKRKYVRPRYTRDRFSPECDCPACTGRSPSSYPKDSEYYEGSDSSDTSAFSASDSESDDWADFLKERSVAENMEDSSRKLEGFENRDKFSLNNDIKNVEQSVLDHFHCEVVLGDGVCEMHRPSCRYCRCLADCPRGTDPMVCPLQWKELFDDKVKNAKDYHQIIQYAKLYHTIYSEGTAIYVYPEEVMTMCKTHKNHLYVDRSFNIGPCIVTMVVFRNQNLVIKADKNSRAPLLLGPVLLHFDNQADDTYIPFFEHIKELCGITTTGEEFDRKSLKGIPTEHRFLYESMIRSFGKTVNFCTRNEAPRQFHRMMKDRVTCYSELKDLVKFLHEQYREDKQNIMEALKGRGKWRLSARAKEVMTSASSGDVLKDFTAVELE